MRRASRNGVPTCCSPGAPVDTVYPRAGLGQTPRRPLQARITRRGNARNCIVVSTDGNASSCPRRRRDRRPASTTSRTRYRRRIRNRHSQDVGSQASSSRNDLPARCCAGSTVVAPPTVAEPSVLACRDQPLPAAIGHADASAAATFLFSSSRVARRNRGAGRAQRTHSHDHSIQPRQYNPRSCRARLQRCDSVFPASRVRLPQRV